MREHIELFVLHLDLNRVFNFGAANNSQKKSKLIDKHSRSDVASELLSQPEGWGFPAPSSPLLEVKKG